VVTNEDIKADIECYDQRTMRLKCQLMDIPGGSKRDRRKFEKKRSKLQKEISHVEGLRQMAQDALDGKFENALERER
jgi:hypothetical protein